MARMYYNAEIPRRYFRDSLQLKNWILDPDATCHMILDIFDFILRSLVETENILKLHMGISPQRNKQEKLK